MKIQFLLRGALCAGALLLGVGFVHKADAATFTVTNTNDSGVGSLRQAISDAYVAPSDDTIVFDANAFATAQTITLTSGQILPFKGNLTITGPSVARVTLSGGDATRIFQIYSTVNLTLNHIDFTKGYSDGIGSDKSGGVIQNNGVLTINDCTFSNNHTAPGGGGGAIWNISGELVVNSSRFFDNTAPPETFGVTSGGGAICSWADGGSSRVTINNSVFSRNGCTSGAAIRNSADSTLVINGSEFSDNTTLFEGSVGGYGGAISQDSEGSSLTVDNSTFSGNKAQYGGAIISSGSSVAIRNCTFASNAAIYSGGAINSSSSSESASTLSIDSSTFVGNSSQEGGGICLISTNERTSIFNLNNSLFTRNTGESGPNIFGSITAGDYNLVDDTTGTTLPGSHNIVERDPLLGPLAFNGGSTKTFALLSSSPAINAGSTNLTSDQREVARDSLPDIGAFESVPTAPKVELLSPLNASDKVGTKRTFSLTVSDANGARDIKEIWLLLNERLSWNAGATLIYVPSAQSPTKGLLYLRRGDAFLAPIQVGEGATASAVLDNGVVRVVASEVKVTVEGNTVTLTLPLTVRDGLVGTNRVFGRVVDGAGATDPASLAGDDGYIRFGTYTVTPQFSGGANSAPVLSRLTPGAINTQLNSSGIAAAQTFSFAVKDDNGTGDVESVWFLAGKQRNWTGSSTFIYQPRSRRLYLRSDDGNSFLGGGVIGTTGILENSQVRVDLSQVKTTIYPDGKTVGLSLPLQAKSGLLGQNKVWLRAQDNQGATAPNGDAQGYVLSGTWNVTQGATLPNSTNNLSAGGS